MIDFVSVSKFTYLNNEKHWICGNLMWKIEKISMWHREAVVLIWTRLNIFLLVENETEVCLDLLKNKVTFWGTRLEWKNLKHILFFHDFCKCIIIWNAITQSQTFFYPVWTDSTGHIVLERRDFFSICRQKEISYEIR